MLTRRKGSTQGKNAITAAHAKFRKSISILESLALLPLRASPLSPSRQQQKGYSYFFFSIPPSQLTWLPFQADSSLFTFHHEKDDGFIFDFVSSPLARLVYIRYVYQCERERESRAKSISILLDYKRVALPDRYIGGRARQVVFLPFSTSPLQKQPRLLLAFY